jgi:hypothetical protein
LKSTIKGRTQLDSNHEYKFVLIQTVINPDKTHTYSVFPRDTPEDKLKEYIAYKDVPFKASKYDILKDVERLFTDGDDTKLTKYLLIVKIGSRLGVWSWLFKKIKNLF